MVPEICERQKAVWQRFSSPFFDKSLLNHTHTAKEPQVFKCHQVPPILIANSAQPYGGVSVLS